MKQTAINKRITIKLTGGNEPLDYMDKKIEQILRQALKEISDTNYGVHNGQLNSRLKIEEVQ